MTRIARLIGLGLLATQAACVVRPFDGQEVDAFDSPVSFEGLAHGPKAKVIVQVLNYGRHIWQTVGTAVSDTTPLFYFGQTMYKWEVTVTIAEGSDLGTAGCRWYPDCGVTPPPFPRAASDASVRVNEEGWFPLLAFDQASQACFLEKAATLPAPAAYARCRVADRPEIIHLHLKGN